MSYGAHVPKSSPVHTLYKLFRSQPLRFASRPQYRARLRHTCAAMRSTLVQRLCRPRSVLSSAAVARCSATAPARSSARRHHSIRGFAPSSSEAQQKQQQQQRQQQVKMTVDDAGAWGAWQVERPKFTQLVVDSMRSLYPEELADRKWDNVGLLVDNAGADTSARKPVVMVTADLTFQVAADAVEQGVSVIVSYHPFIFSGLKSVTKDDPQQATLLNLIRAGIAVYCPHTAVDAAPAGLNTWLADIVAGPHPTTRSVAIPCTNAPESHSPAGYGVLGVFESRSNTMMQTEAVPLADIVKRLAHELGGLRHVMIAAPVGADIKMKAVRSFGVCAGSGYDVLKAADVDLLVMGETSHHSALRAIQQGRTLVQVFHSNSERAYLSRVLRPRLEALLRETVPEAAVIVSEHDKDPFRIIDVESME